jgi:hypothetical protein
MEWPKPCCIIHPYLLVHHMKSVGMDRIEGVVYILCDPYMDVVSADSQIGGSVGAGPFSTDWDSRLDQIGQGQIVQE